MNKYQIDPELGDRSTPKQEDLLPKRQLHLNHFVLLFLLLFIFCFICFLCQIMFQKQKNLVDI